MKDAKQAAARLTRGALIAFVVIEAIMIFGRSVFADRCHPEERSDEGSGLVAIETTFGEAVPSPNGPDPSFRSG